MLGLASGSVTYLLRFQGEKTFCAKNVVEKTVFKTAWRFNCTGFRGHLIQKRYQIFKNEIGGPNMAHRHLEKCEYSIKTDISWFLKARNPN